MLTIPAIDLRGGRVVRLKQGDFARETRYDADPAALAESYADAGATWLHVVDLDGARSGGLANLRVIEQIVARSRSAVQAGGGVRSKEDLQRLFDAGVARAVVGSVAVRDPLRVEGWVESFGVDRICIGLDARETQGRWVLPSAGWTQEECATLEDRAASYAQAGVRHMLCTDIGRDGMLTGPNLALYARLKDIAPSLSIIASGGIRGVGDLCALRECGVASAILGRSLLEGRIGLAEALAC